MRLKKKKRFSHIGNAAAVATRSTKNPDANKLALFSIHQTTTTMMNYENTREASRQMETFNLAEMQN